MLTTAPGAPAGRRQTFEERGYLVVRGLLSADEVRGLLDTFMAMHAGGPIASCFMPKLGLAADGSVVDLVHVGANRVAVRRRGPCPGRST